MCFDIKMILSITYLTVCILLLPEMFAYSYRPRPSASEYYDTRGSQGDIYYAQDDFYDHVQGFDDGERRGDFVRFDAYENADWKNHDFDSPVANLHKDEEEQISGLQKRRRQAQLELSPPPGFQKNRPNPNNLQNSNGFSWGDPKMSDDFFVFDAFAETTTTTEVAIPGMETTQSPCEDLCRTTFQYNPVCGSNGRTFYNPGRLSCAQKCGQKISLNHIGAC